MKGEKKSTFLFRFAGIFLVLLILFGCTSAPENVTAQKNNVSQNQEKESGPETKPVVTGDGVIVNVGDGIDDSNTPQKPATSQTDCATLTPSCGSCLSKPGCGWCKSSNSCLYGDSNGPKVSSCQAADWTVTTQGCSLEANGKSCSDQYNCASCLSGSGCKWCIAGTTCVSSDSKDSCTGGWLNQSYQCNYASR